MKQLKLISNEKNEFIFDSGGIVQTEVTLVMTNPNRDAKMILHHGSVINFISVQKDGSHYDSTIYFYGKGEVTIKNSKIEGSLGFTS